MNCKKDLYKDLTEVILPEDKIRARVAELGVQITNDYKGKEPVAVCILKGAVMFYTDLVRCIDLPVSLDFMAASSYYGSTESTGIVHISKDIETDVAGKDVLLIEDIVDSGTTLSYIKAEMLHRGAASIRIATLLDKPARRKTSLKADYVCFEIPDAFVVGYGLDYDQKYRNLPDVGILDPRVYSK